MYHIPELVTEAKQDGRLVNTLTLSPPSLSFDNSSSNIIVEIRPFFLIKRLAGRHPTVSEVPRLLSDLQSFILVIDCGVNGIYERFEDCLASSHLRIRRTGILGCLIGLNCFTF